MEVDTEGRAEEGGRRPKRIRRIGKVKDQKSREAGKSLER